MLNWLLALAVVLGVYIIVSAIYDAVEKHENKKFYAKMEEEIKEREFKEFDEMIDRMIEETH